jgi:hypothetical protein
MDQIVVFFFILFTWCLHLGLTQSTFEANNITELQLTIRGVPGQDGHEGSQGMDALHIENSVCIV